MNCVPDRNFVRVSSFVNSYYDADFGCIRFYFREVDKDLLIVAITCSCAVVASVYYCFIRRFGVVVEHEVAI